MIVLIPTIINLWLLVFGLFFVFSSRCDNNAEALMLPQYHPVSMPASHNTGLYRIARHVTSGSKNDSNGNGNGNSNSGIQDASTIPRDFRDSLSMRSQHQRWTGVLLLSMLQQQGVADVNVGVNSDEFGSVENTRREQQRQVVLSSPIASTTLATANNNDINSDKNVETTKSLRNGQQQLQLEQLQLERDKVERILDANTILLKKNGTVRLAGVRMPSASSGGTNSNFQFPTCFTYSPSYKVRQLLPKKTSVRIQTVVGSNSNNNIPQVVLTRSEDSLVVNEELVKTGFAVVKTGFAKQQQQQQSSSSSNSIIDAESLLALQENARSQGLGIFSKCNSDDLAKGSNNDSNGQNTGPSSSNFVAEFEPLERSMETIYLSDGGKRQVRDKVTMARNSFSKENPPKNPGDVRS